MSIALQQRKNKNNINNSSSNNKKEQNVNDFCFVCAWGKSPRLTTLAGDEKRPTQALILEYYTKNSVAGLDLYSYYQK
jgi:hypothetical protein